MYLTHYLNCVNFEQKNVRVPLNMQHFTCNFFFKVSNLWMILLS